MTGIYIVSSFFVKKYSKFFCSSYTSMTTHARDCQCCPMREAGYQLDYFNHGSETHLGHYYTRYRSPRGETFHLWHQHLCAMCKYDGTLFSRMTFSAPVPKIIVSKPSSSSSFQNLPSPASQASSQVLKPRDPP